MIQIFKKKACYWCINECHTALLLQLFSPLNYTFG